MSGLQKKFVGVTTWWVQLPWLRIFNLGYNTSAHQFWALRIKWVLKSIVGKEISSPGAARGYGSSRGPPSCEDCFRPWLDAWLLQVLAPSFKHGLNGQAFLLSDVVVSFCRDEVCGKIKRKVTSRLISDKIWLSIVLLLLIRHWLHFKGPL